MWRVVRRSGHYRGHTADGRRTRARTGARTEAEARTEYGSMSESGLLSDERITGLAKGFVAALLVISLLNLAIAATGSGGGDVTTLSVALLFVYVSVVLVVGVFADRPFGPRVQIALFAGLTVYWAYDYLSRDNTLSVLLVLFGVAVLVQQARRLLG